MPYLCVINLNNMKRKMIGQIILISLVLITIVIIVFVNTAPQFGKSPSKEQQKIYAKTGHYEDANFKNKSLTKIDMHLLDNLKEMFNKGPNRDPSKTITVEKVDSLLTNIDQTRITWMGHSSFLIEIEGKKILLDPVYSEKASPVSFIGVNKYFQEMPISLEAIDKVDAVIISHDHYDHLDYKTILKIKNKTDRFFVPLGVDNHLLLWGVEKEKMEVLDWWDTVVFKELNLACTPARHFSGRGLTQSKTLWASWVIKGKKATIFFSGDSGYDTHFKHIGEKYGPFDIALIECGQYHKNWKNIHMMPEEAAQAAVDLKSKLTMPIHWGAFTLAFHDWTEPVERMLKKSKELNIAVTTPRIGEPILLGDTIFPIKNWWNDYVNK